MSFCRRACRFDLFLFTVLKRFAAKDVGNLPVVTREQPDRPIGIITRSGLWAALETAKELRAEAQRANRSEDEVGAHNAST